MKKQLEALMLRCREDDHVVTYRDLAALHAALPSELSPEAKLELDVCYAMANEVLDTSSTAMHNGTIKEIYHLLREAP